jgi:heptosyltransferase-2
MAARLIFIVFELVFGLLGFRRPGAGFELAHAKRVLVVRSDDIGDVVLTSPFLRELRRNLPTAWITLVVRPGTQNLADSCPYVDEVLTYDWRVAGRGPIRDFRRLTRALALAVQRLWHRRFDVAICPRGDLDYCDAKFVVYLSGARYRFGYARAPAGPFDRPEHMSLLYTKLFVDNAARHEAQRGLDIIRYMGGSIEHSFLELWTGQDDDASAARILHGLPHDSLVVSFGIGAGAAKRMWPIENFVVLGRWLIDHFDAHIVVIGSLAEARLGEELSRRLGPNIINAVGLTTLREAGSLLKRCALHIGNDSGPMHLAAAAGVSVVQISCHPASGSRTHPNSAARFGPWLVSNTVVQPQTALSPCFDDCRADHAHCILRVHVESVKYAVESRLLSGSIDIASGRPKHDAQLLESPTRPWVDAAASLPHSSRPQPWIYARRYPRQVLVSQTAPT